MTREEALQDLLRPIKWHWSSSIGARKSLVRERRALTRAAYPFLSEEEKVLADIWFDEESHSCLWD